MHVDDVARKFLRTPTSSRSLEHTFISRARREEAAEAPAASPVARASCQGLTLVHISAQRKHILWDTLAA